MSAAICACGHAASDHVQLGCRVIVSRRPNRFCQCQGFRLPGSALVEAAPIVDTATETKLNGWDKPAPVHDRGKAIALFDVGPGKPTGQQGTLL